MPGDQAKGDEIVALAAPANDSRVATCRRVDLGKYREGSCGRQVRFRSFGILHAFVALKTAGMLVHQRGFKLGSTAAAGISHGQTLHFRFGQGFVHDLHIAHLSVERLMSAAGFTHAGTEATLVHSVEGTRVTFAPHELAVHVDLDGALVPACGNALPAALDDSVCLHCKLHKLAVGLPVKVNATISMPGDQAKGDEIVALAAPANDSRVATCRRVDLGKYREGSCGRQVRFRSFGILHAFPALELVHMAEHQRRGQACFLNTTGGMSHR